MEQNEIQRKNIFSNSLECFLFRLMFSRSFFFRLVARNKIRSVFLFSEIIRTEFHAFFSSAQWFRTKFRSSGCFSLLRNGRNSEYLYLPRNDSKRNTELFSVSWNGRNNDGMNLNFHQFRVPWNNFFLGNWQPYSAGSQIIRQLKTFPAILKMCRQAEQTFS